MRGSSGGLRFLVAALLVLLARCASPASPEPSPGTSPQGPDGPRPDTSRAAAQALYEEGRALSEAGRLEEAATAYEKAVVIDPSHGDARSALGWARYRLGRVDRKSVV